MTISRLSYRAGAHRSKGSYGPSKLEKKLLDRVEPLFEVDGDEPASQVSLSYSRLPDGNALISHAVGRAAHALYLDGGVTQLNGLLPVELWRSPVWEHWDEAAQSVLEPGPRPKPQELVDYARAMSRAADGRLERFLADVRALFASAPGRQIVVIADDSNDIVRLIRIACASLPTKLAERLTFNTRSTDPHTAFQQIVGAQPRRATTFTEAEARHQYRVHNLPGGGVESPVAEEVDRWAQMLAAKWLDDGVTPEEATELWIPPHAHIAEIPKHMARPTVTTLKQQHTRQEHDEHEERQAREEGREREPAAAGHPAVPAVDPLAEAGSWQLPPTRSADPKPLFDVIRSNASPDDTARILAQFADVDLGRIPGDVAGALGERLRAKAEFVESCAVPLAALQDGRLLDEAFRDLETSARLGPHGMLTGFGFQAMAESPLRDRIPADCGRLRFLIHAVHTQLSDPRSAISPSTAASLDPVASAVAIPRILRAASLEADHGEGSTLATILSLYWPPPAVVPIYAAVVITDGIRKNKRRLSDDTALRRLAESVLMAPAVERGVMDLAEWLLGFRLSPLQDGALSVLVIAARIGEEQASERVRVMLDEIKAPLRDGDGVPRSEAVTRWWIDRTIDALFRSPAEELWISAVPALAACNDERLLQRYRARVVEPGGPIEILVQDPEVLDRADVVWRQTPDASAYWMTARDELSNWVDRMRKKDRTTRGRNRAATKWGTR